MGRRHPHRWADEVPHYQGCGAVSSAKGRCRNSVAALGGDQVGGKDHPKPILIGARSPWFDDMCVRETRAKQSHKPFAGVYRHVLCGRTAGLPLLRCAPRIPAGAIPHIRPIREIHRAAQDHDVVRHLSAIKHGVDTPQNSFGGDCVCVWIAEPIVYNQGVLLLKRVEHILEVRLSVSQGKGPHDPMEGCRESLPSPVHVRPIHAGWGAKIFGYFLLDDSERRRGLQ